jgi:hypothetical protein
MMNPNGYSRYTSVGRNKCTTGNNVPRDKKRKKSFLSFHAMRDRPNTPNCTLLPFGIQIVDVDSASLLIIKSV